MSKFKLSPPLHDAVFHVATSILNGKLDDDALASFVEQTNSITLKHIAQCESEIRSVIYKAQYEHGRHQLWKRRKDHRFIVPWFDLFSGDGFRRERALRTIKSGAPTAFLLAILLRRLNDWVPQVREAARIAVKDVLAESDTEIIVSVAWVLLPVRSTWGRLEDRDLQVLDTIADRESVASRLADTIERADSGPAATILRQASRRPALDKFLPRLAKQAVQPAVRALAHRMLLQRQAVWQVGWQWRWTDKSLGERVKEPKLSIRSIDHALSEAQLIEAAANDPAASVRRVAGDGLVTKKGNLTEFELEIARQLETDPYPSVAERGRFVLQENASS